MHQFDVLAVGDVVTDAFIRLTDEDAKVVKNDQGQWLMLPFGTKLPFEYSEVVPGVGNASNAAVTFARLGLKSSYVTNVGSDQAGREIIDSLGKNGVDIRFVRINPGKKSNYHYVLWYKEERTILIKHEDYDYHWPHIAKTEKPRWVYFSSLSEHALPYQDRISDWLENNPDVFLAFQPGTFQMEAGTHRLRRLYRRTAILILNREEAAKVGGGNHEDMHDLIDKLHALGPQVVVVTDGPNGAYASDGKQRLRMPLYPDPKPPLERTGAGDAFASAFVAAAVKGMKLEDALRWGPINSMSVCQKVGSQAGILTERELLQYLHHAPHDYIPTPF
ncbi:MAG TPA: carbohydrate kinase family protein [Patescibacteria group bacterium]|nr:carbohydrate kinase family protein [Patescibacteria group bacterium]